MNRVRPLEHFSPNNHSINQLNSRSNAVYCDIEDEMNFIQKYPVFQGVRKFLTKSYYWKKPSMYKFIQLMSTNNLTELPNLGKYILRALKLRSDLL